MGDRVGPRPIDEAPDLGIAIHIETGLEGAELALPQGQAHGREGGELSHAAIVHCFLFPRGEQRPITQRWKDGGVAAPRSALQHPPAEAPSRLTSPRME